MQPIVKVGIVGYGYATATFHAPLIASVSGLALTAISTRSPPKVIADWPQVDVCESPQTLFARPDIDLVIIPTPNETHHPLAAQALAAGKHVVVDKPFTLDVAQARDLIQRADQAQRVLSVFHNRRWDADFLTLKSVLTGGQLGRVTHFESHFDRYRPVVRPRWRESGAPGSGLWYDLGSHLIDQALQLFGRPRTLMLDLARERDGATADDSFHAVLRYEGLRVVLHASALVAHLGPRFAVHGTRGSFTKFGLDTQEDALKSGRRPGAADWGVDPLVPTLTLAEGDRLADTPLRCERGDYPSYYAGVRDAVLRRGPNPVPAEDALQVIELIELGLESARSGRVAVVD